MDVNTLRSITTVMFLIMFLGIVAWAYAKRNQQRFEELGQLPLQDDVQPSQGARDE